MASKLFFFAAVVAAASPNLIAQPGCRFSPLAYVAPLAKTFAPLAYSNYEEYSYPQYNFAYDVQDGLTGDSKSQHESRDGAIAKYAVPQAYSAPAYYQ